MQKLWQAKPFGACELMKQPVMMLVAVVALTLSMWFTQNKATTISLDNFNEMQFRNVKTEQVTYKGRKALRVTDAAAANVADGIQLVMLNKAEFQDGVIPGEVRELCRPRARRMDKSENRSAWSQSAFVRT
jgi:hypothetical protein